MLSAWDGPCQSVRGGLLQRRRVRPRFASTYAISLGWTVPVSARRTATTAARATQICLDICYQPGMDRASQCEEDCYNGGACDPDLPRHMLSAWDGPCQSVRGGLLQRRRVRPRFASTYAISLGWTVPVSARRTATTA